MSLLPPRAHYHLGSRARIFLCSTAYARILCSPRVTRMAFCRRERRIPVAAVRQHRRAFPFVVATAGVCRLRAAFSRRDARFIAFAGDKIQFCAFAYVRTHSSLRALLAAVARISGPTAYNAGATLPCSRTNARRCCAYVYAMLARRTPFSCIVRAFCGCAALLLRIVNFNARGRAYNVTLSLLSKLHTYMAGRWA